MVSWKLWRTLYDVPLYWRLPKVLQENHTGYPRASELVGSGLVVWMCLCTVFPFILIPLTVTYLGFRMAWSMANVLARQHELGRYNTLAVIPVGGLGMMLEMGRICRASVMSLAKTLLTSGVFTMSAVVILVSLVGRSVNLLSAGALAMLIVGVTVYLDYRQTFVASYLIGVLAGTTRETIVARFYVVTGCVGMQVAMYTATTFVFFAWMNLITSAPSGLLRDNWIFTAIAVAAVTLYVLREIVIVLLWRWLRLRLNDDLPAFKVMINQRG